MFGLCLLLLIFVVRFPAWVCRKLCSSGGFYFGFGTFLITIWSGFGSSGFVVCFDLLRVWLYFMNLIFWFVSFNVVWFNYCWAVLLLCIGKLLRLL